MAVESPFKYLSKMSGKSVLVLGGSSGIGYAVAEAAVEHGADVVVSSSKQAKVEAAVTRLQAHARRTSQPSTQRIRGTVCDVAADSETVEENIVGLLEFATDAKTRLLDHVAYTAGDAIGLTPLSSITVEEIHKAARVRQFAAVLFAKHVFPDYINANPRSSLTFTNSSAAGRPSYGWSVVVGIAAAIEGHARGFAVDLAPVRVNVARLGIIPTEFFENVPDEIKGPLLDSTRRKTLTGTLGTPADVAEVYMYFMKDSFATGIVVTTDGGIVAGEKKPE